MFVIFIAYLKWDINIFYVTSGIMFSSEGLDCLSFL